MRSITVLACALLAGCVAAQRPDQPKMDTPAAYTTEPLPNLSLDVSGRFADDEAWWKTLKSAPLDAAIEAAFAGNRNFAVAQASLRQARELVAAQSGALSPSLELAGSGARQKYGAAFLGPSAAAFPPFTAFSVGANVSYLLDYTGGVRAGIRGRAAQAEAARYVVEAARLALAGNVALEAIEIASTREQIKVLEGIAEDDRRNVDLVAKALKAGTVARVDLLTAQTQLAQDQTLLPPLRQSLSVSRHAMAVLVGQAPGSWTPPEFELAAFALPADIALVVPSQLAHRRPDILADEARLSAAAAAVGVATANLFPQIKLTGSLSQQALTVGTLFDAGKTAFSLAGNLTAPLFNGGRLRAERRAAQAGAEAALSQYQQTVLAAFGQIADVLTALEHDAEQIQAQEQALDAAESNLTLTRQSYGAGNVGVLQVLEAGRAAQRARVGVVQARAQRLKDLIELRVALGGGQKMAEEAK